MKLAVKIVAPLIVFGLSLPGFAQDPRDFICPSDRLVDTIRLLLSVTPDAQFSIPTAGGELRVSCTFRNLIQQLQWDNAAISPLGIVGCTYLSATDRCDVVTNMGRFGPTSLAWSILDTCKLGVPGRQGVIGSRETCTYAPGGKVA